MNIFVRTISPEEYAIVRCLDRDAFAMNERGSDGEFHSKLSDHIRKSPYYIPELDLVAVTDDGDILGHGIFSALPMGDDGEHVIWLHSLAVKHDEKDSHEKKSYTYQRRGIGKTILNKGLSIAKELGYTACMTCGNPDIYRVKMGFFDCRDLDIKRDDSVDDPDGCVFARKISDQGFEGTNKTLSYRYYNFEQD